MSSSTAEAKDDAAPLLPSSSSSTSSMNRSLSAALENMAFGRYQLFILVFGFFTSLTQGMLFEVYPLIATSMEKDLGVNSAKAQTAYAALNFGTIISSITGGLLADRFGRKTSLILFSFVTLAACLLTPAARHLGYIATLSGVKGVGVGGFDAVRTREERGEKRHPVCYVVCGVCNVWFCVVWCMLCVLRVRTAYCLTNCSFSPSSSPSPSPSSSPSSSPSPSPSFMWQSCVLPLCGGARMGRC